MQYLAGGPATKGCAKPRFLTSERLPMGLFIRERRAGNGSSPHPQPIDRIVHHGEQRVLVEYLSVQSCCLVRRRMSVNGRFCCKSRFQQGLENSKGRRRGFRVKMRGTSSPRVKLTGDFGRANEATRIGDYFLRRVFAKNWSLCNFRLLQQNRHKAAVRDVCSNVGYRRISGPVMLTLSSSPIDPKLTTPD